MGPGFVFGGTPRVLSFVSDLTNKLRLSVRTAVLEECEMFDRNKNSHYRNEAIRDGNTRIALSFNPAIVMLEVCREYKLNCRIKW